MSIRKRTETKSHQKAEENLEDSKGDYVDAVRELRRGRVEWKFEKLKLKSLKAAVLQGSDTGEADLVKEESTFDPKAHISKCEDQMSALKQTIAGLQYENQRLRGRMASYQSDSDQGVIISELEEQLHKWETLYTEVSDLGSRRVKHLEKELVELRHSASVNEQSALAAEGLIADLRNQLQRSRESELSKNQELKDYKQKSRERMVLLKDMLCLAQGEMEKEQEILRSRATADDDTSLLDQIEYLESQLEANGVVLAKERARAAMRECELEEQLHATRKLADLPLEQDFDDERSDRWPIIGMIVGALVTKI
eukprot:Nitzschia sp. Nitz4//scaffold22_size323478//238814//239866//NITZ4_000567-RA/size323478-snap-gene-0.560-mRNA-1//-1//CDS//3329543115//3974//frame0